MRAECSESLELQYPPDAMDVDEPNEEVLSTGAVIDISPEINLEDEDELSQVVESTKNVSLNEASDLGATSALQELSQYLTRESSPLTPSSA